MESQRLLEDNSASVYLKRVSTLIASQPCNISINHAVLCVGGEEDSGGGREGTALSGPQH